jgi:hypothetical protein
MGLAALEAAINILKCGKETLCKRTWNTPRISATVWACITSLDKSIIIM